MNVVNFFHFLAMLLIAGGFIRFVELKWPDSAVGRALGVLY